jgi:Uma2 family endonuclease
MTVAASRRLFTVEEFHQMADAAILRRDDRVELLAGDIVEMTPIGSRHAACVSRINRLLSRRLGDAFIVRVQDPLYLDEHSEPQPDIAIVKARDDFYRDRHPRPDEVCLVIEVADTSAAVDRVDKVPLYGRSGIPEVWVVDLTMGRIDVYRGVTEAGYRHQDSIEQHGTLTPSALPGLQVRVQELIG